MLVSMVVSRFLREKKQSETNNLPAQLDAGQAGYARLKLLLILGYQHPP
jgi:hypothetical protein